MKTNFVFISDSVTEGHPDKLCDQISDAIVDHFLERDPYSRIITECAVAEGVTFIAARFASEASVDIPVVARQVIREVGYEDHGDFSARDCSVLTSLVELPPEMHVKRDEQDMDEKAVERLSATHQVTVFGFACDQTPALMPLPIWLAHCLARRLNAVRLSRLAPYLTPDGTTQVGVEYRNSRPYRIQSITLVVSQQTVDPDIETVREDLIENVIKPVFIHEAIQPDENTRIFINPDGPRVGGGPAFHAGLTGRKTAIDTYGGFARHSGSALSGKDPLRIDRIAAYAARYAAKNVVAAGLAEECEVQLSYSIGLSRPVSLQLETFGTGTIQDDEIARRLEAAFDFRMGGIIRAFDLRHMPGKIKGGFYQKLAAYGQVGRMDIGMPWEKTDQVEALR